MQYGTAVSVLSRRLGRAGRGEDAVARYVIAETASGRTLDAVLADSYVENRLDRIGIARLLDRKDVIDAVGGDAVKALRARLGELRAP
jgi:Lhr-like helicase